MKVTFDLYAALASLVKYGNLYRPKEEGMGPEHMLWRAVTDDGYRHPAVRSEIVEELVVQGLAKRADHDHLFALGKVVPTEKAQAALEKIVLTPETEGVGSHLSHCCLRRHGCKYSHEFCPVETEMLPPVYERCAACHEDDHMRDEELATYETEDLIHEVQSRGYTVTKDS